MKKRKVEQEDQRENFLDVLIRNWKNVPGFRSLIKLGLYLVFIFIFIVVVNVSQANDEKKKNGDIENAFSTTTKPIKNITYKEILDNVVKNNKDIYINVSMDGKKSIIDAITTSENIIGYYETDKLTKKFKFENNILYEVTLEQEAENDKVLNGLNLDFIVPSRLITILKNNIPTKVINDDEVVYNYDITINNMAYKVTTTVKENILIKIEIANEKEKYTIIYE